MIIRMSEFIRSVAILVSRQDPVVQHCSMGGAEAKRCDTRREREGGEDENSESAGS